MELGGSVFMNWIYLGAFIISRILKIVTAILFTKIKARKPHHLSKGRE